MKTATFFLLLAVSAAGLAAAADAQEAHPLDAPVREATALLAQRDDADSLAAAALLTLVNDPAGAEQLAGRASAAAPKRPDLVWLQAQLCRQATPDCDGHALDAKLRALDPENGVTFLPALTEAAKRTDPAQTDRLLGALAASKRVDLYWNSLIQRLATAVLATQKLTADQSVITVTGLASAIVIPAFAAVGRSCQANELLRDGRRPRCQGAARALQQGDTAIAEMMGLGMARDLWPDDSPEARAAREARRVFDYRSSIWNEQAARLHSDEAALGRYLDRLARYHREQDVIVAEIVAVGGNPTPPADWHPKPPGGTPGPAAR